MNLRTLEDRLGLPGYVLSRVIVPLVIVTLVWITAPLRAVYALVKGIPHD